MAPGLSGVVLCGGDSTRMGSDKAALVLDGERLVDRAVRRLGEVADPVMVAPGRAGRLDPAPAAWCEVDDVMEGRGPLAGIAAALAASPQPLVAVVAVDMVQLDGPMLAWLATLWSPGDTAVVPLDEHGRTQPLHAVYAASAAPAFAATVRAASLAVRNALDALPVREVGADEWSAQFAPGWSRNVNRPEDLA